MCLTGEPESLAQASYTPQVPNPVPTSGLHMVGFMLVSVSEQEPGTNSAENLVKTKAILGCLKAVLLVLYRWRQAG